MNFVEGICAGDGEHVVGVLVSVGDHGGGGGERSVGDAGEGESSEIQLIKGNREIHRASDAKTGRTISST